MHNDVRLSTCAGSVYTPIFRGGLCEKGFNAKCIGFITDLLCMNQLRFASNIVKMVE